LKTNLNERKRREKSVGKKERMRERGKRKGGNKERRERGRK
jgi:hypothetical protein